MACFPKGADPGSKKIRERSGITYGGWKAFLKIGPTGLAQKYRWTYICSRLYSPTSAPEPETGSGADYKRESPPFFRKGGTNFLYWGKTAFHYRNPEHPGRKPPAHFKQGPPGRELFIRLPFSSRRNMRILPSTPMNAFIPFKKLPVRNADR